MSPLSIPEARRFYDRFGAKQDKQVWYEAAALDDLVLHSDLANARSIFELGCGTGRLALESSPVTFRRARRMSVSI